MKTLILSKIVEFAHFIHPPLASRICSKLLHLEIFFMHQIFDRQRKLS